MNSETLTPSQAFARSVKSARQLRNWNQKQLAERLTELGVPTHQATVARVEKKKRGVSLDDAVAFSLALDMPLIEMIGGAAVADYSVALTPKEAWSPELVRMHLRGEFSFSRPGDRGPYYSWRGRGDPKRFAEDFERLEHDGRVRREQHEDGSYILVATESRERGDDNG